MKNLWRNISGGASRMRSEHLKRWLVASKRKKLEAAGEGEGKMGDEEGGPTEPHWGRLVDQI